MVRAAASDYPTTGTVGQNDAKVRVEVLLPGESLVNRLLNSYPIFGMHNFEEGLGSSQLLRSTPEKGHCVAGPVNSVSHYVPIPGGDPQLGARRQFSTDVFQFAQTEICHFKLCFAFCRRPRCGKQIETFGHKGGKRNRSC